MKKLITVCVFALTVCASAYLLAQAVNAKSVTAQACPEGTSYCG